MDLFLTYALYLLAVLAFSIFVVLAIGGSLHLSWKVGNGGLVWVFPLITLAIVSKTIFSKRDVDAYVHNPASYFGADGGSDVWILRVCMWTILAICAGIVLSRGFARNKSSLCGKGLLLTFILYWVGASALNAIFGSVPSFDYKTLYAPLIVSAYYLGQQMSPERFILSAKTSGLFAIGVGLLAAIAAPQIALQTHYTGTWIPGVTFRLWGLDSHANTLGPLTVMILIMELCSPYKRKLLHWGALLIAFVALLLTQSKTSWMSFAGALGFVCMVRIATAWREDLSTTRLRLNTAITAVFMVVVLIGLLGLFISVDIEKHLHRFLLTDEGARMLSMTGRDSIWRVTLVEWRNNVLFGYGPKIWGPEFSIKYHLLGIASNAHNQLVDLLGSSGLIGLSCFLGYVLTLASCAWKVRLTAGLLPMALLVALLIRSVSEVPFRLMNVLSHDFVFHLIIISIVFGYLYRINSKDVNYANHADTSAIQ